MGLDNLVGLVVIIAVEIILSSINPEYCLSVDETVACRVAISTELIR